MALILLLVLIAVIFGFLGALIKGLLWLLVIGVVLFVAALVIGGIALGRRTRSR